MLIDGQKHPFEDDDPQETQEWIDSLDTVATQVSKARARFLLTKLWDRASRTQIGTPKRLSTDYVNTIPPEEEPNYPGDLEMEYKIRSILRWNAAAMVVRANARAEGIGGHLASFASSALLYDVGFNHFFRGREHGDGDFIYFQGHAAPGMYARSFLEGRFSEENLDNFRQEVGGKGLSSYPHPRLMPDYWEFPTVSMGLGPINAIYQARFARYMHNRGLRDTSETRIWGFLGDGECDEPETMGAITLAAREELDNLTFVINCNLQRLDGPVRGNGKIIQELEALYRGAGWNVIKVVWGSPWDELFARDTEGVLLDKMNTTVDGVFQKLAVEDGAYMRQNFFGTDPRLLKLVENLSDDELKLLPRGGHDARKVYAAYKSACEHQGQPTVILAQTLKGWALGSQVEGRNSAHQIKKMSREQFLILRDRLKLEDEIPDSALEGKYPPYYRPGEDSPVMQYVREHRNALGGPLPRRVVRSSPLPAPKSDAFAEFNEGSADREVSTTMAFAVMMRNMLRDKEIGKHIVPIIPDEARTFGMDALFKTYKIYAPFGQKYEPVDAELMLSYSEATNGQILEEGITEAGAMASFTAAATSYTNLSTPMIPFYVFYSMFGFQRIGDLAWALGDSRGRGFMMGATAGRTTLMGEGLQHDDGHSLVLASTIPNIYAYDPAFAYETAAIIEDGIARMYGEKPEDRFYYITLYNENYVMPAMPSGPDTRKNIVRGIYKFRDAPGSQNAIGNGSKSKDNKSATKDAKNNSTRRAATIMFSGTAWSAAMEAQRLLSENHAVDTTCYSVTSYKNLRDDALATERWNRLHPTETQRVPLVSEVLSEAKGPFVAVTDFMKIVPEQVARWIPGHFTPLGTDGYGHSDTRTALRQHFEVDAGNIVVAVLSGLAATGDAKAQEVADAIKMYEIDSDKVDPTTV